MNNAFSMSAEQERQKNLQALAYTAGITALVLLLIFFIKWGIPEKPVAFEPEMIEINLGSDDDGFGKDQPQLPGEPASALTASTPVPTSSQEESARDISDPNETSADAPTVYKPPVSKPDARHTNAEPKTVRNTAPAPTPAPPAPKPKGVMGSQRGGNGNGGNGADSYVKGGSEGDGSGSGDKGVYGGNPNGTSYSGTPKNFGVRVVSIGNIAFEDDFDKNGKVALMVEVSPAGKLLSAEYTSRNSTGTATPGMISIAKRRAKEVPFPATPGGQKGIIVFDFKTRN